MAHSTYAFSSTSNHSETYENPWNTTPLFFSLQFRQELHNEDTFIPTAGLTMPIFRLEYPKSYLTVLGLEVLSVVIVKLSLIYSGHHNALAYLLNQECFDYQALLEMFPQIKSSSVFHPPTNGPDSRPINTPYLPRNFTVNLSISAPYQVVDKRVATIFVTELFHVKNVPRFVIPLTSLCIYFYHIFKKSCSVFGQPS